MPRDQTTTHGPTMMKQQCLPSISFQIEECTQCGASSWLIWDSWREYGHETGSRSPHLSGCFRSRFPVPVSVSVSAFPCFPVAQINWLWQLRGFILGIDLNWSVGYYAAKPLHVTVCYDIQRFLAWERLPNCDWNIANRNLPTTMEVQNPLLNTQRTAKQLKMSPWKCRNTSVTFCASFT